MAKVHKGAHLRRLQMRLVPPDEPGKTFAGPPNTWNANPQALKPNRSPAPRQLPVPATFEGILSMSFAAAAMRRVRNKFRRSGR